MLPVDAPQSLALRMAGRIISCALPFQRGLLYCRPQRKEATGNGDAFVLLGQCSAARLNGISQPSPGHRPTAPNGAQGVMARSELGLPLARGRCAVLALQE